MALKICCTQSIFNKAGKRKGASCHGSRQVLVSRLRQSAVKSKHELVELAGRFEADGAEKLPAVLRSRNPTWRANESVRLCHVLGHTRHSIAVGRLLNCSGFRNELINVNSNPWYLQFVTRFNSDDFCTSPRV